MSVKKLRGTMTGLWGMWKGEGACERSKKGSQLRGKKAPLQKVE